MAYSVRPHRRQPTRLPRPWDSPGKNTGVGCHFLLQCMQVKVKSVSRIRLLATPWAAAHQAPPSMRLSQARVLEWAANGKNYGERVSKIFLPALLYLVLCSWWVQEPLNWFLDFSQKKLFHVLILNWYFSGRKEHHFVLWIILIWTNHLFLVKLVKFKMTFNMNKP